MSKNNEKIAITDRENWFRRMWRQYPVWCNVILMILSIVLVMWLLMLFIDLWTHHGENSTVPDIKGMSYDKAVETLRDADLDVVVMDSVDNDGTRQGGTIVEVVPKPGAVVKRGREVYVTIIAYSPHKVTIPEPMSGNDLTSVQLMLGNLGFNPANINVMRVPSDNSAVISVYADGRVIDMGSTVPVNARIQIEVGYREGSPDDPNLMMPGAPTDSTAVTPGDEPLTPEVPDRPSVPDEPQPAQDPGNLYD